MKGGRGKVRRPPKHGRLAHDTKTDSSEESPPQRFAASARQDRPACSHIQGRGGTAAGRTVCRPFVWALLPYPLPARYGGSGGDGGRPHAAGDACNICVARTP